MRRFIQSNHILIELILLSILIPSCYSSNNLRRHIEWHQIEHQSTSFSQVENTICYIFGFISMILALSILWHNERRNAITEYRLEEAKKLCTSVNSLEVNPNTNNQLIHTNGLSQTSDLIVDAAFGLTLKDCVKLVRTVEMYLWVVIESQNDDGSTSVSVFQEWSTDFCENCGTCKNDKTKWIVEKETQINQNVRIGAYLMSKSLALQTNANQSIIMTNNNAQAAAYFYGYSKGFENFEPNGKYLYFQQNKGTLTMNDLRVSFDYSKTGPTTVVSQQYNDSFTSFVVHDKFDETVARDINFDQMQFSFVNCCCCCCKFFRAIDQPLTEIDWIFDSIMTQNQVFKKKINYDACVALIKRILAYLIMGIAFSLLFYPNSWVVSLSPLVGYFLASLTGYVYILASFIITIPINVLIIGCVWLRYQPKQGIAFIVFSALIGVAISYYILSYS
ncbi:unnamed protein product [Paramecium pentaurelia]|uniref:Transmembrane protein n=1 Tax=Paramecium pentaurelia TaxID=43138 RepID=A0A8S1W1W1_9CILI|nr:unnamed protein product [Paramecium pentaurelia]